MILLTRFCLLVLTITSLIFASLFSKSIVFVELAIGIVILLLSLSLVSSLKDPVEERRVFWAGYFAAGIATIFWGHYCTAVSEQIANFVATPPTQELATFNPNVTPPSNTKLPDNFVDFVHFATITTSIPIFLSFFTSIISGVVLSLIFRRKERGRSSLIDPTRTQGHKDK